MLASAQQQRHRELHIVEALQAQCHAKAQALEKLRKQAASTKQQWVNGKRVELANACMRRRQTAEQLGIDNSSAMQLHQQATEAEQVLRQKVRRPTISLAGVSAVFTPSVIMMAFAAAGKRRRMSQTWSTTRSLEPGSGQFAFTAFFLLLHSLSGTSTHFVANCVDSAGTPGA